MDLSGRRGVRRPWFRQYINSLFVNVRCCFLSSFFVNKKSHGLTAYHLYDMPVLYL